MDEFLRRFLAASLILFLSVAGFASQRSATAPLTITITGASNSLFPLSSSANKRYFVDQSGRPFLMVADAAHRPINNIPTSQYSTYLSDRNAQGFNTVNLFGPCAGSASSCTNVSSGAAFDGTLPFTSGSSPANYDFCTPNNAYWTEIDSFITAAGNLGMLILFEPLPWGNGWSSAFQNNTATATCLGYTGTKNFIIGAYLGNRYKNTNVIWTPGQDFDSSNPPSAGNLALIADFMAGIASTNPAALISVQLNFFVSWSHQGLPICGVGTTCANEYSANLNSDFGYTYHETYDAILQAYNASPTMPVFHGEGNYEGGNNDGLGHLATAFDTRIQAWWAMTSGAAGFVWGNTNVEHFVSGWQNSLDTVATSQVQFVKRLFDRLPWQTFVPDQSHTLITAGFGTYNGTNGAFASATYCTTTWDSANYALVFCPASTTLTANMALFSKPVTVQWYDTTSGMFQDIAGSPFANSGTQTFISPGAHSDGNSDWVLVFQADPAANILDPSREVQWASRDTTSLPVNRPICQTTACNTLLSSVTSANISSALSSASANSTVMLPSGTFSVSGVQITQNNVTLRGQGADQTKLVSTGDVSCATGAVNAFLCIQNSGNWSGGKQNQATWTSGFAKGTTVITLSSTTNLAAGGMIILSQNGDNSGFPTSSDILVSAFSNTCPFGTICSTEGASQVGNGGQTAIYRVQAVSGNNVTIYPPLEAPNWRSGQSPIAWWPTTSQTVTGVGIENMTIDCTATTFPQACISFTNTVGDWLTGNRIVVSATSSCSQGFTAKGYGIQSYLSAQILIRSNYLYGCYDQTQENYSIWTGSGWVVENNITENFVASWVLNGPGENGTIFGYNYAKNGTANITRGIFAHNISDFFVLGEGNDTLTIYWDDIHGTHNFPTFFRNYVHGETSLGGFPTALSLKAGSRNANVVGNVLGCGIAAECPNGTSGYYTTYQSSAANLGGTNFAANTIYDLGGTYQGAGGTAGPDSQVPLDVMRWGNYDSFNAAVRFVSAEVPNTLTNFSNAVPASQTLPNSLYWATRPPWWSVSIPFPATGPDVTTGTASLNMGGHTYKIPARTCYESLSGDSAYPSSNPSVKSFNAKTCYGQ